MMSRQSSRGYITVPLFAKELDKSETFNSKKEETGAFASYCRYSEVHFCQESSL